MESQLLQFLECPVCLETMSAPIYQCIGGHNICNSCKDNVQNKCPTCRQHIAHTRNFALEQLAENLPKQCKYHENGCTFKATDKALKEHEDECAFNKNPCPLAAETGCTFLGFWNEMVQHVQGCHKQKLFVAQTQFQIRDFDRFRENVYLLLKDKDLFKVVQSLKLNRNSLEILVFYVGLIDNTTKYLYKIEIADANGTGNLATARSDVKPIETEPKSVAKNYNRQSNHTRPPMMMHHHHHHQQQNPHQWMRNNNNNSTYSSQPVIVLSSGNTPEPPVRKNRKHNPWQAGANFFEEKFFSKQSSSGSSGGSSQNAQRFDRSDSEYVMSFSYSYLKHFCRDEVLTYELKLQKRL